MNSTYFQKQYLQNFLIVSIAQYQKQSLIKIIVPNPDLAELKSC